MLWKLCIDQHRLVVSNVHYISTRLTRYGGLYYNICFSRVVYMIVFIEKRGHSIIIYKYSKIK